MDEKLPRGVLSEHIATSRRPVTRNDVELAGELWDVEYEYLTLGDYTAIIPSSRDPVERKIAVAETMKVKLNGSPVVIRDLDPLLGLALVNYLDKELSENPGKNL